MRTLAAKLGHLRKSIEEERGDFTLFAFVLPEDTIAWDLLVAAKWIDDDQTVALRYLVEKAQKVVTKEELLAISGISILNSNELYSPSAIDSETGWEENNIEFYGRQVQKAYVFKVPLEDFQLSVSR